jgi:hypothetical protein
VYDGVIPDYHGLNLFLVDISSCPAVRVTSNAYAGGRAGLDANVLSAYCNYAEEMEDLNACIASVY